jgi:nucleotide-binding universal stress UspA family protein
MRDAHPEGVSAMGRTPTDDRSGSRWRLVVAVDGSVGAADAVAWTARLASSVPAEVVAVHALPRPLYVGGYVPWAVGMPAAPNDWRDEWRVWANRVEEALADEWCRPLREAGIAFRTKVIPGGAGDLLSYVLAEPADLLIVGRRGLGGFKELVLGSFSHQLVHHSSIPVIVVPSEHAKVQPSSEGASSVLTDE